MYIYPSPEGIVYQPQRSAECVAYARASLTGHRICFSKGEFMSEICKVFLALDLVSKVMGNVRMVHVGFWIC